MSFSASDFAALDARLQALGEEKYRNFNESLIPGKRNATYGVRIPALRAIGKELVRGNWQAFLACPAARESENHEIVTLYGLVIAGARCTETQRRAYTADLIPRIDNWAANDTVCATYRIPAAERGAWLAFLRPYLTSGQEFPERFALILLMDQFLQPDSIDFVLDACLQARCPGYYTRMAVAWTLCTAFCHERDKTLAFLQDARGASLDAWTYNKAIQKCRESYRVSDSDKALLQRMRRAKGGDSAVRR